MARHPSVGLNGGDEELDRIDHGNVELLRLCRGGEEEGSDRVKCPPQGLISLYAEQMIVEGTLLIYGTSSRNVLHQRIMLLLCNTAHV